MHHPVPKFWQCLSFVSLQLISMEDCYIDACQSVSGIVRIIIRGGNCSKKTERLVDIGYYVVHWDS